MSPRSAHSLLVGSVAVVSLLAAACGDDDGGATVSDTTETTASDGTDEAAALVDYCAAVEELNGSDAAPTLDQLRDYADQAPDEIQEPISVALEVIEANDGDFMAAFSDPDAAAAIDEITAFEEETCGTGDAEDEAAQDPSVTQIDPNATRVDIATTDYAFDFTPPTTAGRYSFVTTNDGEEPHILVLARLEDGATLETALQSEGEEGVAEEYTSDMAPPTVEAVVTADLTPGNWVLLCPIPDDEGTPHLAHGMLVEFAVT